MLGDLELNLKPILDPNSEIRAKKKAARKSSELLGQLLSEVRGESEILLDKDPYEAFKRIKRIITACKQEFSLLDPYTDERTIALYLESLSANIRARIITKFTKGNFLQVAMLYKGKNPNFEARRLNSIHDRYLFVDSRAWLIGQSLKDAGRNAPLSIVELRESRSAKALFESLWGQATRIV